METFGLADILLKRQVVKDKSKKGGIQDPLTEQRALTATFLNIPLLQVCGLTKGWTANQLYRLRTECLLFKANPQALFWKKYKLLNKTYGRSNKKVLVKGRKERRGSNEEKGQRVLF